MNKNYQNVGGRYFQMAPQEFNIRMDEAIQQDLLHHPEKITDQRLALERDAYKSNLRINECFTKQKMKNCMPRFFCVENNIWLQILNGTNTVLSQQPVFYCRIEQIKRYQRDGLDEIFWQLILIEGVSGLKVFSPLYGSGILQSNSKLRKTILLKYQNIGDTKYNTLTWTWMRGYLLRMIETSEIIKLPLKAGWFEQEESWRFWTAKSADKMLLSEQIKKFYVDKFPELCAEDVVTDFQNISDGIADCKEYVGMLLILRLCAIFARLTVNLPLEIGVAIVGEKSLEVAEGFLRTMHNNVDIVNLDADRMGKIQKQVELLQDTPAIFVSSDPDSKSTRNRLQRVMSWLRSGYIEGSEVDIPFVFCLKRFSKFYPLDDIVLLDADEILIPKGSAAAFAQLQNYIIQNVEKAGSYYVHELRRMYKKEKSEAEDENKFLLLVQVVVDVVLQMFNRKITEDSYNKLEELLYSGEDNIITQLKKGSNTLLEVFQKKVEDLVGLEIIYFIDRNKISYITSDSVIYYDDEFYYFTSKVLNFICQRTNIDYKTLLLIKQQLAEQNLIKLYKNRSSCNRDLGIDFLVCSLNGERKRLSGLAIKRQFWNKIGGIALEERRGYDEITL